MSVYALLRELRDAFFIFLVGFRALPYAKIGSLFFLLLEMILYQKMIDRWGIQKTFLLTVLFFSLFLGFFGLFLFFSAKPTSCLWGYLFYCIIEGYPPFVWSSLWSIFTFLQKKNLPMQSLSMSLYAQIGGCTSCMVIYAFAPYFTQEKTFFSLILLYSSICLLLTYLTAKNLSINHSTTESQNGHKEENSSISEKKSFSSLKSLIVIFQSRYVFFLFSIGVFWEIINTLLNYIRLDIFTQQSAHSGIILLRDLYKSTASSYCIGIILLLGGTSSFVKKYGVKKTLLLFPTLILTLLCIVYVFNSYATAIWMYMVIRALYPALIFPIKETLYSITEQSIQFKTRSWVASFGSRISKTVTSLYMNTILSYNVITQRSIHQVILFIMALLFFFSASTAGSIYENEKINEE